MDKYEFNIKVEQIKKMVSRGDYETAMKIADTIDWRRVRNVNILSMVATIYEKNEEYQEAKDILLLAFERAPIGKRLLFKLAELAIKEGSLQEAEDYYREFCDLAPDDPRQYILRYLILGAKGAPAEQLIHTLEQYCNIELDEKWIYELAELYAEAGMGELCIMTCDKIMLMFGLGKYVEKAMELKIQFAPLTKYQMDLVENRDKYEARLKAVEQEYRAGKRPADYEPVSDRKTEVSPQSYMARQEAAFAAEPEAEYTEDGYPEDGYAQGGYQEDGYPEGGYQEDEYPEGGYQESGYAKDEYPEEGYTEGGYQSNRYGQNGYQNDSYTDAGYPEDDYSEHDYEKSGYRSETYQEDSYADEDGSEEAYGQQGYYGNEYPDQDTAAEEPYEDEGVHAQVTIEPEDSDEGEEPVKETQSQWMPDKPRILSDEAVRARMHEAEVQANLAKEMSRMSDGRHRPETTSAQTRVLTDIKDLGRESSVQESHHFMIEAEYSSSGLDQAIELLKEIHKETGAKNQAAKITGEKLNSKGVFAIADKLTGKDLIIEQAGAMEESTLQELNQLMARDETGMNVVLIDVAGNLARIHKVYPGLAKRFEYVGKMGPEEVVYAAPEGDDRPVRPVQPRKAEEAVVPRKVRRQTEEPAVNKVQPVPEPAAPRSQPKPEPDQRPDTEHKSETGQKPKPVRKKVEETRPDPVVRKEEPKEVPVKTAENPAVLPQPDEPDYDDQQEMDIDEFAQYACQYASDIDCSISGKSMLALYERIEIMEEDGVPLTKVNAEDLIEEAADKAENPSFIKRITGIFSSKYDRDGLLILKEEHFI
ncbi:hypothetical protein [Enterocloster bolteae]|uniref:hypothetical protein n=1 Tax=Enterocloster bolteae TaxID=208479 RepID=UPI00210B91E7|nr:hypothetical protein [Enterocloster bolteae]MCQ5145905.1 hypothetical protein [Enterocloster bolteae]